MLGVMRYLLLLALLAATSVADGEPKPVPYTPEARDKAIAKAFRFLDANLWKLQDGGSPRRQYSLAVAGWAYLLAADKPKGAKRLPARSKQIRRIRDELARYTERVAKLYDKDDKQRKKNRPAGPRGFAAMRTAQYSWPLPVIAHFFAEGLARGKARGEAKKALKAIVRVLEASQQTNGGWGHDDASRPGMGLPPIQIPKPGGGKLDYPGTLHVTSHLCLGALGLAHKALKTKRKTPSLDKGRAHFETSQNGDGTWPYDPSQKRGANFTSAMAGGIEVARTPGCVLALLLAGAPPDDPMVKRALAAIDKKPEYMSEGHGSATLALQWGALMSRARGAQAWKQFRGIFLPRILGHQQKNGGFTCVCKHATGAVTCDTRAIPGMPMAGLYVEANKTYVTAIHALILVLDRTESRITPEVPAPKGAVTPSERN